jgi:hypothetical protein
MIAVAAIAAVVIVAVIVLFRLNDRGSLDNSVVVLGKSLGANYKIERKKFGDSVTDLSGVWSVRSKSDLAEKVAAKTDFARADDDDLKYFRQLVVDALGSRESFDGYVLYRAKLSLGEGTICSALPCSIYVFVKAGGELSYIGIYKT